MKRLITIGLTAALTVAAGVAYGQDESKRRDEGPTEDVVRDAGKREAELPTEKLVNDTRKRVAELPTEDLVRDTGGVKLPEPVDGNPRVAPGKVRWHASLATARRASAESQKPVLLFQLLGRLDQEFC